MNGGISLMSIDVTYSALLTTIKHYLLVYSHVYINAASTGGAFFKDSYSGLNGQTSIVLPVRPMTYQFFPTTNMLACESIYVLDFPSFSMALTSKYPLSVFAIISYTFGLTCNPLILHFSSSSLLSWVCQVAALFGVEFIVTGWVLESETLAEAEIAAETFPLFSLAVMLMIYFSNSLLTAASCSTALSHFSNYSAKAEAIVFFSEEPFQYPPVFWRLLSIHSYNSSLCCFDRFRYSCVL